MRIETHGHQIEVTPALREYVESKLGRLSRHFDGPHFALRAQLSVEKPMHKAEATVSVAGKTHHADCTGVDMYAAIALLYDKLDRLLAKHKGKLSDHHRGENPVRDGSFG